MRCQLSPVSDSAASVGADPIARAEAEVALRHARDTANPSALTMALCASGWTLTDDEPDAALAALDESITLCRLGASPGVFGMALSLAAGVRARTGDLPRAARDHREGIERSHQSGNRAAFYLSVWFGIEILAGLDHHEQAAIFEGIVSTGFSAEWRAGTGLAAQHAVIAHARAAHGSERYDAAFQTGAAMTYDQAVEHTLRVLHDLINETDHTTNT